MSTCILARHATILPHRALCGIIRSCMTNQSAVISTTSAVHNDTVAQLSRVKSINLTSIKANNKTNRFYRHVNHISTNHLSHLPHTFIEDIPNDQYAIMLDSHCLTTPDNRLFVVPTEALACIISSEWDMQTSRIHVDLMPLTHICMIANDQAIHKQQFIQHFNNYIKFDSTCIRAANPTPLVRLQRKLYDPLIDRMYSTYNTRFNVATGIMTPNQSADVYSNMSHLLTHQSALALACLDAIASVSKSLIIAWNMYTSHLSIDQAYRAARLDEDYQIGMFGHIDGVFGHSVEMTYVRMRLAAAQTILNLATIQPRTPATTQNTER